MGGSWWVKWLVLLGTFVQILLAAWSVITFWNLNALRTSEFIPALVGFMVGVFLNYVLTSTVLLPEKPITSGALAGAVLLEMIGYAAMIAGLFYTDNPSVQKAAADNYNLARGLMSVAIAIPVVTWLISIRYWRYHHHEETAPAISTS